MVELLYLIEILHQTTTLAFGKAPTDVLYLIEILHQTTTISSSTRKPRLLYLIEILHQTTTVGRQGGFDSGCILSKFYIKPQPCVPEPQSADVVSYRNSTSNHNLRGIPA